MDASTFEEVVSAVRRLIRDEVIPREQEIEDSDAIPDVVRKKAAAMGLFGYALPEAQGGLGLTLPEDVRLSFEFGYTTSTFRSLFGTNNGIAGQVIAKFGTPEQKDRFLPDLCSGDAIASFALTEVDAGSDPSGLKTTGKRDGDDWIVDGQKRFITNAPLARHFVTFVRTDPSATGGRGISAFVIDADMPGVTVGPKDRKMGQSGAWTAEVAFENVRVNNDRLIGGDEGTGYSKALTVLARGRVHIAAICVGQAQRIQDESVAYAAEARQGGKAIGDFQLVQAMLADNQAEIMAGRAMVREAAERYQSGEDINVGPSAAKLFCAEMVGRVADRGVQVHGGLGYMREITVERFYRDVRLFRLYEGTSEIQKLVIGRSLVAEAKKRAAAGRHA